MLIIKSLFFSFFRIIKSYGKCLTNGMNKGKTGVPLTSESHGVNSTISWADFTKFQQKYT